MATSFRLALFLLFLLLSTLSEARVSLQVNGTFPPLRVRQDSGSSNPDCFFACEIASCGNLCAPVEKRDVVPLGHPHRPYKLWNEAAADWEVVSADEYNTAISRRSIGKRAFTTEPRRWTVAKMMSYLPGQIRAEVNEETGEAEVTSMDKQFSQSRLIGFFSGTEGTVSAQKTLGADIFQMGTGGLHGCTMHTTRLSDDITPGEDLTHWQVKVLNSITGQGTQDSKRLGPAINWELFNQDQDNTEVYIFAPGEPDPTKPPAVPGGPETLVGTYPNKIGLLSSLLIKKLPGARLEVQWYRRLLYTYKDGKYTGPDAKNVDKSHRGITLFQYDGIREWRLFLEARIQRGVTT
ncbi:hypothetical protein V491_04318 [Pseudogymnoascus sp. VKM F-3775]|nr:hypothetical protein V491_04318 [Pseudogymnoascus sp. VKM F-3775]